MSDDHKPTLGLHVDTTHPSVIRADALAVWIRPVDGAEPPSAPTALDDSWRQIGVTTDGVQVEEEEHEIRLWGEEKPQRTVFTQTASLEVGDVSMDTFRRLLGIAPVQRHQSLTYGWVDYHRPPPAPTKSKRLTGKAYRIARRRHHRLVKRLRRLAPTSYVTHVPRVRVDHDASDFEGHGIRFQVLDEVSDFVLPDLRYRDVE